MVEAAAAAAADTTAAAAGTMVAASSAAPVGTAAAATGMAAAPGGMRRGVEGGGQRVCVRVVQKACVHGWARWRAHSWGRWKFESRRLTCGPPGPATRDPPRAGEENRTSLAEGAHSFTIEGPPPLAPVESSLPVPPGAVSAGHCSPEDPHSPLPRSFAAPRLRFHRCFDPQPTSSSHALPLHSPAACDPPRDLLGLSRAAGVTF